VQNVSKVTCFNLD